MVPNTAPDMIVLQLQRRRHHELHTTNAASYEVAARVHAELAAMFEAAGQRERAHRERELAADRTRKARQAQFSAAAFEN
jgi:hypothetical protein